MTALNEYWKHWEHKKYWMSSDDVPEGVWKAYEIAPENEIVAPNWEPYIRKAFLEMDTRGIELMRCLCALRVWTDDLAAHTVPRFER